MKKYYPAVFHKEENSYWVEFPDYTADELTEIFRFMMMERGFAATDDAVK